MKSLTDLKNTITISLSVVTVYENGGYFMKIEHIFYLNDIAQTHSISQTAQRFFISQQALSIAMKKLEDENRCNRRKSLTLRNKVIIVLTIWVSMCYYTQSRNNESKIQKGYFKI